MSISRHRLRLGPKSKPAQQDQGLIYGYFSAERFVHANGTRTDEIAMNPAYRDRLLEAIASGNADQFAGDLEAMGIEVGEDGELTIKNENKSNRIKYTCSMCETNIWGKPDLNVMCGDCNVAFEVAN